MGLDTTTDVQEIENIVDADGQEARVASDERLESVRQQGANGSMTQLVYATESTNPEQVDAAAVPDGHGVVIQAAQSNTDYVYIGDDGTQGHALGSRESITVDVDDTSEVYVQAQSAGDEVVLTWVTL